MKTVSWHLLFFCSLHSSLIYLDRAYILKNILIFLLKVESVLENQESESWVCDISPGYVIATVILGINRYLFFFFFNVELSKLL